MRPAARSRAATRPRTRRSQGIKLQRASQIGLKRADAASAQWYRDRVAALRIELRTINQGAQTPEQKAAQYKSLQERARALAVEFQTIKEQNRRALGLSDDGKPLTQTTGDEHQESIPQNSGEAATIQ
jgi:hypothetical protein